MVQLYDAYMNFKAEPANYYAMIRKDIDHICQKMGRKTSTLHSSHPYSYFMMMSSNGNIFHATDPLWAGSTGHRLIPLIEASHAELLYFLCSAPGQTVEQAIETPVI